MAFETVISDEAKLDIEEARNYYVAVSSNLLLKFDTELIATIELIAVNPQHFQKRYRNIKIVFTKNFPFGVHYIVENNTN